MRFNPIVTSNNPAAARLIGLTPGEPFMGISLPLSEWIRFARAVKAEQWRSGLRFPLTIRETSSGFEIADADDVVIASC